MNEYWVAKDAGGAQDAPSSGEQVLADRQAEFEAFEGVSSSADTCNDDQAEIDDPEVQ